MLRPAHVNTPHRKTIFISRTTHTTVVEADDVLKAELRKSVYVKVPELIETMFGGDRVDDVVGRVYHDLVDRKIYLPVETRGRRKSRSNNSSSSPATPRWQDLPLDPSSENEIYDPLRSILNDITTTTRRFVKHDILDIVWRDEHGRDIQSDFLEALRPDIVATFTSQVQHNTTAKNHVWWRHVHTPMEIKKKKSGQAAMLQLFYYVRQTLKEQPDRRFVYGLLYAKRHLTVWLADRSGVLGTCAFDVHQAPQRFIRVIVGLLIKDPSELGWDPTMLAYVQDESGQPAAPIPSYKLSRTKRADKSSISAYDRKWVVEMNVPGQGNQTSSMMEKFLLFRAISLSHAEVIRGRSTRIWLAWKWDDVMDSTITKKERKIYVFKDCWRDDRREQEGKLYRIASKGEELGGVASVYSYGIVKINGNVDETLPLVRKSVKPGENDKPVRLLWDKLSDGEDIWIENEDIKNLPQIKNKLSDIFEKDPATLRNRIHSRLVMSTSGWPLTKLKSLHELAGVLYDAVAGHQRLYNNGVLHRDISYSNILITTLDAPNRGVLIDLDYAIETSENREVLQDDEVSGTLAFMSYEILSEKPYDIDGVGLSVRPTFNVTAGGAIARLRAKVKQEQVKRHPIHDLEGLFWVICFLCVSREGPARARRFPQESITPEQEDVLQDIDKCFLTGNLEAMKDCKRSLMQQPRMFERTILANFSPYFEPFLDMVEWLYDRLRLSYSTRNFDGIHELFLEALEKVEKDPLVQTWHDSEEHHEYLIMEQEEEQRRREDQGNWDTSPQRVPTTATQTSALTSIVEEADELSELSELSEDELPSSLPTGKWRKLNNASAAPVRPTRKSSRLSSVPQVPVRRESISPSERAKKRKLSQRQSSGIMTAGSSSSVGMANRSGGGSRGGAGRSRGGRGGRGGGTTSLARAG